MRQNCQRLDGHTSSTIAGQTISGFLPHHKKSQYQK